MESQNGRRTTAGVGGELTDSFVLTAWRHDGSVVTLPGPVSDGRLASDLPNNNVSLRIRVLRHRHQGRTISMIRDLLSANYATIESIIFDGPGEMPRRRASLIDPCRYRKWVGGYRPVFGRRLSPRQNNRAQR